MSRLIHFFLFISTLFAWTHHVAVAGSLYWYYWWFDIFMHFWGGLLIGLGVHALCRMKSIPILPSTGVVLTVLFVTTFGWEVFELLVGSYAFEIYILDTILDIVLGFSGGLLAHFILQRLYNRTI